MNDEKNFSAKLFGSNIGRKCSAKFSANVATQDGGNNEKNFFPNSRSGGEDRQRIVKPFFKKSKNNFQKSKKV